MTKDNKDPKVKGLGCLGFTIFGLPLLIALTVFIIWLGWYAYSTYNKCVTANEFVKHTWSDVENTYQKRMDLIPNIVATVKGYAEHEQKTFTAVTEARAKVSSINIDADEITQENLEAFDAAQSELSGALSRLLATVENYPELKANQNFLSLQNDLNVIEIEITQRRKEFNASVKDYNILVLKFPRNLFAKMFDFKERKYFEAAEEASTAPKVEF
ncbi:MAG: LemA family protein [Bacteroidales bacterium]|nr:LemA family protein [Bacteroidales bacterium]MDD2387345.1 LemA family protein [Bacteroidales bacterium]MDD4217563.1 LemA family protein [Bacteroidales bacterium]MDY0140753.1 LemA family protein [Bacteroidales bacterium]